MDSDEKIIEDVVKKTMLEMEQRAPIQMHRLKQNEAELQEVLFAARKAATEEVKMAKDFTGQPSDILKILTKHLPDERVQMIKEGLSHSTYRMEISKMADGHYSVSFNRDGKTFLPPRDLTTALDIDWATIMQYASIVVEAVLLVLSAVGISASPSAGTVEKTAEDVAQALKNSSAFEKAVESFVKAWKASGSSATEKAKALFFLLKDTYTAGVLWTTIKSLCSNMSALEWAKTAAKVTAMIIAAFATEGVALIAKIALIILSAVDFAKKLANLEKLEEAKSALN